MKSNSINLGSYSITIARDNTGNPAAYVSDSQESSASGSDAILDSYLDDARNAGAEDELYAAIEEASKNPAAVALGSIKSARKSASSAANGKRGGRPSLIVPS